MGRRQPEAIPGRPLALNLVTLPAEAFGENDCLGAEATQGFGDEIPTAA